MTTKSPWSSQRGLATQTEFYREFSDRAIEVDVLDAQLQAFHQTKACAVKKSDNGREALVNVRQEACNLLAREDHGKPNRTLRPAYICCSQGRSISRTCRYRKRTAASACL